MVPCQMERVMHSQYKLPRWLSYKDVSQTRYDEMENSWEESSQLTGAKQAIVDFVKKFG